MEENVKEIGNLFVVDPNPPGGGGLEQIPPEDLFIYVKFTARPRSRQVFAGTDENGISKVSPSGVEDEVNFISTEIKYTPDGKIETPEGKETVDSFATTNWTGIGGLGTSSSGGLLEGFGMKSIDIKYSASLVPEVNITFTDVRGSGLFDVIKDNDRLSPYSLFFKMPYPIFTLSVKGYFGQTVEYCLHMTNWTSNFDGSTGNFDISAEFLGFQQAFLNDMVIGNIIANVQTEVGITQLNKLNWTYEDDDGEEFTIKDDIRKLDDLFLQISRLQINVEVIKSNSVELDELKDLNGQLSLLKQIRGFIGTPIIKSKTDLDDKEVGYLNMKNTEKEWVTTRIKTANNLVLGDNYLSVRDYLIINSINISAYKSYIVTLTDIINQYKDYFINQKITATDANTEFESSFSTEEDSYMYYVNPSTIDNGVISFKKLEDILVSMSTANDNLYLRYDYNVKSGENNKDFKIENFQKDNSTLYNGKLLSKDSKCFVVDFRKQRATLENLYKSLIKDIKIKTKNTNDKLNTELTKNLKSKFGFNPTIENCFRILTNNTQAMISSIHEITKTSSGKELEAGRKDILKNYSTDIPGGDEFDASIAWPAVYRKNDDKSEEEIYLGEIEDTAGVNNNFPEKVYVDSIFEASVAREKALQEVTRSTKGDGLDTDNWFPINPIDYDVNPYTELNFSSDDPAMYNVLANRIFLRVAVLKNYSLFEDNTGGNFADYSNMDGISANLTIFGEKTRGVIDNILKKLEVDNTSLHNTKFYKDNDNVVLSGSEYTIKDNNKIGDIEIGGRDSGVDFIQFDTPGIINNVPSLPDQISTYAGYNDITKDDTKDDPNKINKYNHDTEYIKQRYENGNLTSEIQYNVWDNAVSSNLYKNSSNKLDDYKVTNISNIDISGLTGGKYINKTNFYPKSNTICGFEESMIESDLYQNQTTIKAKALLLLSTLPFRRFKEAVLDVVFPGKVYSGARIIKLPEYYIYFIGAYLWNYENDGIEWNINFSGNTACPYNLFETDKNLYLTKLGYMATTADKGKEKEIEPELLKLPKTTKDKIIKKFEQWAKSGKFKYFESNIKKYIDDANSDEGKNAREKLRQEFTSITNMIVFAPKIFDQNNSLPTKLTVKEADIKSYIKSLSSKFTKTNETNINKSLKESDIENNEKHNNKLKLAIYKYFKNINDKWVAGIDSGKSFNVCGSSSINNDKNLIDYFKFIDRGWSDIGQKAVFNLNSFLTLSSNFKTSVYYFMSKLLADSNFLFQILPTYINFKDSKEVAKMFQPITTIENNQSSGPMYACIYIGGASKVLDIKERKNYYFKNDGFSFPNPSVKNDIGTVPPGFATKSGDFSQVAFRVAFGAENQTIFKNVSLNQQEHKETAEYFAVLSDIIDKRGGTQKTYVGTDLYKLYDARSYTCKVDALGCMNIQPLMYFDLQNVPFFKGAYLITNVNHNITPNHMTTNFQGVRQSKLIVPPPTDITVDLGLDLGESTKIPKLEFINLQNNSGKFVIGVLNPNDAFDFTKFTIDNFKLMGVSIVENNGSFSGDLGSEPQLVIDEFKELLKTNLITTNKQVCMIMGNIMTVSNNMSNKVKDIEPTNVFHFLSSSLTFDKTTIYSGQTVYYGKNPNTDVKSPFHSDFKDPLIGNTIKGITPTFTGSNSSFPLNYIATSDADEFLANVTTDGNLYNSDANFFAPRGYLYVKGRQEYFDYFRNSFEEPFLIAQSPTGAFEVSVVIWTKKKGKEDEKTSFETVKEGNGGANSYSATVGIVNGVDALQESFETFDNVLRTFNLHNDFFI